MEPQELADRVTLVEMAALLLDMAAAVAVRAA
jgi:hypothetical protein